MKTASPVLDRLGEVQQGARFISVVILSIARAILLLPVAAAAAAARGELSLELLAPALYRLMIRVRRRFAHIFATTGQ
jgi:hypothetical protein